MKNAGDGSRIAGAAIVGAALLGSGWAVGQVGAQGGGPKVLTAQEFRLAGADGAARGGLALNEKGEASLTLRDKDGKARAQVAVQPDGASAIVLYGEGEKLRAVLNALNSGGANL